MTPFDRWLSTNRWADDDLVCRVLGPADEAEGPEPWPERNPALDEYDPPCPTCGRPYSDHVSITRHHPEHGTYDDQTCPPFTVTDPATLTARQKETEDA